MEFAPTTHTPSPVPPPPGAELRKCLFELEEELRAVATHLRLLGTENLITEEEAHKPTDSPVNAVVLPLEELQRSVEGYDAFIDDQIKWLRHKVDAAARVSASYQQAFSNCSSRTHTSASGGDSPGVTSPTVLSCTNRGVCCDEVRQFLSRFVRWDPLELDGIRGGAISEAKWDLTADLAVNGDSPPPVEESIWEEAHSPQRPHFLNGRELWCVRSFPYVPQQARQKQSLRSVMDDLVLRQLRYDGVSLSAEMEMDLGFYDRIRVSGGDAAVQNVDQLYAAASQEVRQALLGIKPLPKGEKNVFEMVEVTYPKTVQWIAGIVARCTNSPHLLHSSATVTDLVDVLFTPATSAPSCSQCEVSGSKQLANGIAAALNCSGQDEERDEGQEHTLGLESGNVSTAFALSEGSQVLQRHHSADSPWSPLLNGAEVNENSVSGEVADGELPGEAEDHELGLDFLMSSSEVHAQQQEDEYEEDEDEDANEEYDYDEEIDEEDEAEVNEEMFNEEELKELKLEEEELWALRRCKKGVWGSAPCGEAEDVSVSDFLLQRSKIFLSDLIILSALQHLARVIADGRREVCMSSLPTKVCDVGAELLPSMKEAAEFVLALSQHPFVSWRMAVEEDFLMAKTAALTRDEEGKDGGVATSSLLISFRHVLVALGYMSLALGKDEGQKTNGDALDGVGASEKEAQRQLLFCAAPFICLWCGGLSGSAGAGAATSHSDIPSEESNANGKFLNSIPLFATPFAWRESVLSNLLDQIWRLRQLEALLGPGTSQTSVSSFDTQDTSQYPENLLQRLVYPLSSSVLRRLDEYSEKGLVGPFNGDISSSSPQQQPSAAWETQPQTVASATPPSRRQREPSPSVVSDFSRHLGAVGLRAVFENLTTRRRWGRAGADGSTAITSSSEPSANGGGSHPAVPSESTGGPSKEHAIILEMPHASTILSQQDECHRFGTSALMCVGDSLFTHSSNIAKHAHSFCWEPLFQKTMCYCPVTRRRCVDSLVYGISHNSSSERAQLPPTSTPGFNSAQLLNCGHIISELAIMILAERLQRLVQASTGAVQCPYCAFMTPLQNVLRLHYIY
uniref:Uncharacterized protein n=1 Tax=Trypanosoma vivax (strain Y486) TaxID=1055687 RepID=G0TXS1_TRYVY|nr:conserved hypothetical protein [Trypanosoma vivax Y486]